jgi:hypothetical protein
MILSPRDISQQPGQFSLNNDWQTGAKFPADADNFAFATVPRGTQDPNQ